MPLVSFSPGCQSHTGVLSMTASLNCCRWIKLYLYISLSSHVNLGVDLAKGFQFFLLWHSHFAQWIPCLLTHLLQYWWCPSSVLSFSPALVCSLYSGDLIFPYQLCKFSQSTKLHPSFTHFIVPFLCCYTHQIFRTFLSPILPNQLLQWHPVGYSPPPWLF